jgi:hypothetical protein
MATITLSYNPRNTLAQRTLEYILSLGVFEKKHALSSFEKSLDDIDNGRVHRLITPKKKHNV